MANSFYNYVAFISPDSNADLAVLKTKLESFYSKASPDAIPVFALSEEALVVNIDDYLFYIALAQEDHVQEEAVELADQKDYDWNEDFLDKAKLVSCKKRFEIWGDEDDDMNYFNDSLFIMEIIEEFEGVIIFYLD